MPRAPLSLRGVCGGTAARHDEYTKLEALDLGANDWVGKPFGIASR
ncbi:MAG: hypothetical protein J2P48_06275 [Alphaproteobacteria bacterium]|nr:hypothetical protein [Alphaproteobacteria bacterium]